MYISFTLKTLVQINETKNRSIPLNRLSYSVFHNVRYYYRKNELQLLHNDLYPKDTVITAKCASPLPRDSDKKNRKPY